MKRIPMKKASAKKRARDRVMAKAYAEVDARSGGLCEAKVNDWCLKYGTEHQHLYKRNVRPDQVTNPEAIILICSVCHRWAEENPAAAIELGVARHGWVDDPGPVKSPTYRRRPL